MRAKVDCIFDRIQLTCIDATTESVCQLKTLLRVGAGIELSKFGNELEYLEAGVILDTI
jgi:hypothetical protein